MLFANIAETTGNHDRLVVPAHFLTGSPGHLIFKGAEIAGQIGTAKFVVERSATNRPFNHDIQGRGNPLWLAIVDFPRLGIIGQVQVGDRKAGQAGLGLGATARRPFIPNFTAGARRRASRRRDGRRVVVGLHLHQNVDIFLVVAVNPGFRVREETAPAAAPNDRRIILVRREDTFAVHFIGVADHGEQRFFLAFTVNIPRRVENLVPTVFGVRLGEHHQFDVGRIPRQIREGFDQVVDFVFRERQPQA